MDDQQRIAPIKKKTGVAAPNAEESKLQKMVTFVEESEEVLPLIKDLIKENKSLRDKNNVVQEKLAEVRKQQELLKEILKEGEEDEGAAPVTPLPKDQNAVKTLGIRPLVPKNQICYVYDVRMTRHRNVKLPEHLENPNRIISVYQKLQESGVLDRCLQLDARIATREELLWLHTADYIDKLSATAVKKQSILNELERQYDSVFLCPETYQAALLSAGSSLQVVESILSGESRSGVAIIRPPGHLAESGNASGFCYFNNVALAAKYAIEIHHLQRILIVDWSVYHGSGIQKMFEEDPRVLYISLHRQDVFPFNPEKSDGNVVGKGPGTGYTVNIAWPSDGMGDSEYLAAFWRIIMPIASQYNPQLVLVAAGFDAALGDPLGGCKVSPEGYGHMCHMLTSLAEGRVALLLEGGFNLTSTSESMLACVRSLLGDRLRMPKVEGLKQEAAAVLLRVATYLLPYWSSLDVNIKFVMNVRA